MARAALLAILLSAPPVALCNIIQQVSPDKTVLVRGDVLCVSFRLSRPASVIVVMVDSDLQTVKTIALGSLAAGRHVARWDATRADGRPVPPEVYTWQIEARAADGLHTWEPANLHSRPAEQLWGVTWDQQAKTIRIDVPSATRAWVRVGLHAGACMRTLVEGEPWTDGWVVVPWDGRDESGVVDVLEREDWFITAFGYRLPAPCVIVTGDGSPGGTVPAPRMPFELNPPILPEDPVWTRVRGFCLIDHFRPHLALAQATPGTFLISPEAPDAVGAQEALQRVLGEGSRVKWFVDGRMVLERDGTGEAGSVVFPPDQMPQDDKSHFLTLNVQTNLHQVYAASAWVQPNAMAVGDAP